MEIFLIAAVDKNLAIGRDGKIPWHIKEDLQYFQKNTLNTSDKTCSRSNTARQIRDDDNTAIDDNTEANANDDER